jgi:hypothetical protein
MALVRPMEPLVTRGPRCWPADPAKTREQLPGDAPPSFVELAMQCCDSEPTNRPDAEAAVAWIGDLHESTEDDGIVDPPLPTKPDFPHPEPVRGSRRRGSVCDRGRA